MTYLTSCLDGDYGRFMALLERIGFGESDSLYILGNLVDFGEQSMELITDISMRYNVYAIAGAREVKAYRMLSELDRMLAGGSAPDGEILAEMAMWMAQGGKPTLESFKAMSDEMREGILEYLSELPVWDEVSVDGKDYLLTSCGIAGFDPDMEPDDYAMEDFMSEPLDLEAKYYDDKTVVAGASPVLSENGGKIRYGYGTVVLGSGCLCLETGKEYYC